MLILASQSPRRSELLRNAGVDFSVAPADIDESLVPGEEPAVYVQRLARGKALALLAKSPAGALVLGADTTVVLDGESLGKPLDEADARQMLGRLRGRSHQVMTGVCLAWQSSKGSQTLVEVEITEVEFAAISDREIAEYVSSSEPMDKAGAYGIQGRASRWVPRISGCYFNIVGLPVARVCAMLRRVGDMQR